MSESLTDAAPVEDTAATSVEDSAPVVQSEVDAGSGDRSVPVERFNGLMSSFNREKARVADLERQLSELRSELNTKPDQEKPVQVPENDDIRTELASLRELLVEERMKNIRRSVLDEYPDAKPFADLIVADTEDDLRQMAKLISERLKGNSTETTTPEATEVPTEAAATETAEAVEEVQEPPVTGGGSLYDGNVVPSERVADAIRKRNFKDFLAAKWEQLDMATTEAS